MLPWTQAGIFQLRNLVHPLTHALLPFDEIQRKHQIPKHLFYSYLQIKHYFSTKSPTLTLDNPTPFELLCAQGPYQTRLISEMYNYLHEALPLSPTYHLYMKKWSQIINQPILIPQWQKIWEASSKSSRCVEQRETSYKILLFWFRTPEVLHRYDPGVPRVCWRCRDDTGSHFPIFWECPSIQSFWSSIHTYLQNLFEINLPLNPINFLLGLPFPELPKYAQKLAGFILLAAYPRDGYPHLHPPSRNKYAEWNTSLLLFMTHFLNFQGFGICGTTQNSIPELPLHSPIALHYLD